MIDHRSPQEIIEDFVLEKASGEPVPRRVELYRALAAVMGEGPQAACLTDAADELEQAEVKAGQRLLRFRLN